MTAGPDMELGAIMRPPKCALGPRGPTAEVLIPELGDWGHTLPLGGHKIDHMGGTVIILE